MQVFLTWLFMTYFFTSCAVLVAINCLICLIVAPFDPLRRAVHSFSCYWGFHYFQVNPGWKLIYEGIEQIDPAKTYVLIANHQSFADILVCYGLHRYFKWVSKEEVLKTPFIGFNMRLNQYIFLKRGDLKSIKQMMSECRDWIAKGASVMLFPEGTRSEDGELQKFLEGAFKLSIETNVPLVPIVIDGTKEILPKGKKHLNFRRTIRTKVLPPVDPADFDKSPGKMRAYVHDLMAQELERMRGKSDGAVLDTSDTRQASHLKASQ